MKRILLFVAIATSILASCTSDMKIEGNDSMMSFDAGVVETKAQEKTAFEEGDKVGLLAQLTTGDFVDGGFAENHIINEELSYGEAWWKFTSEEAYPWPTDTDERVSFLAYYPYAESELSGKPTIVSGGSIRISWEVNSNPADQKDLLWDAITNAHVGDHNGDDAETVTSGATKFLFNHALSKINIKIKTGRTLAFPVNIANVTIKGIFNKAHYTIANDLKSGSWSAHNAPSDFVAFNGTHSILEGEAQYIGGADNSLLMIPQTFGAGAQIILSYNYHDGNVTQNKTASHSLVAPRSWLQNTPYTYTFTVNTTLAGEITFDCDVVGWADGGNSPV